MLKLWMLKKKLQKSLKDQDLKAKDTQLTILEDLAQSPIRSQEELDEPELAALVPVTENRDSEIKENAEHLHPENLDLEEENKKTQQPGVRDAGF